MSFSTQRTTKQSRVRLDCSSQSGPQGRTDQVPDGTEGCRGRRVREEQFNCTRLLLPPDKETNERRDKGMDAGSSPA